MLGSFSDKGVGRRLGSMGT